MEYEKKYNEALEKAKKLYENGTITESLKYIFPELREPELTPLAQVLSDYLKNDFEFFARKEWDEKKWNEVMNTQAAELLAIAKKEICKGCTVGLDQYWKGRKDERDNTEYCHTFHYPTYQPPCFHGGACTNPMRDCINCPRTGSDIGTFTTSGTCKKED